MEAEFFHADEQDNMTKLTTAFRKFTNAPNNQILDGTTHRNPSP